MADNPIGELKVDPNLTVDAGKIYAKLHLAGKSQVQGFLVVNTGMKDEGNNDTPENPGKATFDLNSKSGEYEVCFISDKPTDWLESDIFEDNDIKVKTEAYNKVKETQKATENNAKVDVAFKDLMNAYKKAKTDDLLKKLITTKVGKEQLSKINVLPSDVTKQKEFLEAITALGNAYEKVKKEQQETEKNLSDKALQQVNAYFKNFAGDDYKDQQTNNLKVEKFTANVKATKDIKIKDFKIESLPNDELKKNILSKVKLGFKVKFTIQKD